MAYFAFVPLAVIGVVTLFVCVICACIERAERRRARLYANLRPRHMFRPRLIQGGKSDSSPAPAALPAADRRDKLAG